LATCFAITDDVLSLSNYEVGFGVFARSTKYKLVDENVEEFAQAIGAVVTIDNPTICFVIEDGLCAELAPEKFGSIFKIDQSPNRS
jgi:hypothetical protein